jgi:hypothetical protein
MIYLRTQADLIAAIQRRLRDTGQARWQEGELKDALNRALESWHGRVSAFAMYELADGWPNDAYEITLPNWLPEDVQPQAKWPVDPMLPNDETLSTWKDINSYAVEPATDGTRTLRLNMVPYNGQVRLKFPVRNGVAPTLAIELDGAITATDTTLHVSEPLPEAERTGWIKVDAEWIQYAGVAVAASTTTLSNLLRGQHDTTAAIHADEAAVQWGIVAPNMALFQQLSDQACAYVHELNLTDGSPKERDLHERMLSYFQGRADMFWRRHAPSRAPRWKYG